MSKELPLFTSVAKVFWVDARMPAEVRRAVTPHLRKHARLVPSWCNHVDVFWKDSDTNEGCAAMEAHYDYRRATLWIYPNFLLPVAATAAVSSKCVASAGCANPDVEIRKDPLDAPVESPRERSVQKIARGICNVGKCDKPVAPRQKQFGRPPTKCVRHLELSRQRSARQQARKAAA